MSGHTPGPWRLNSDALVVGNGALKMSIAIAYDSSTAADGVSREEMKANARLLAAAPELLDALQSFVAAVEDDGEPLPGARWHAEYVAARAAIAKATGAQP